MALYQFYLDSCEIMDTRSVHEDSILAGLGVIVNKEPHRPNQVAQVGDHNNGKFSFWQHGLGSLDQVEIADTDTFAFIFQLFNNGQAHRPNASDLDAYILRDLINASDQLLPVQNPPPPKAINLTMPNMPKLGGLLGQTGALSFGQNSSSISPPPMPNFNVLLPGKDWQYDGSFSSLAYHDPNFLKGSLFSAIGSMVLSGCDGPLGCGLITGTGAELDKRIPTVGPLRLSAELNAKNLKLGAPCNPAGSNYVVNLIIQRQ